MRDEKSFVFADGLSRSASQPAPARVKAHWIAGAIPFVLFVCLSAIWGTTWIAIKQGVVTMPPLAFAGSRFTVAGGLLVLYSASRSELPRKLSVAPKLVVVALLLITFCYGPIFWGMQFVSSGLSALVNLALIPIGLVLVGRLMGQESLSKTRALALLFGVLGLGLLFGRHNSAGEAGLAGVAAITAGTLAGCAGTILSRAWFVSLPPALLSGLLMLIGGFGLLLGSVAFEGMDSWLLISLTTSVIASWFYLTVVGSLIAFTIYLYLVQTWGAFRSGLYAFVSPVVALVSGYLVFDERLLPEQLLGSFVLLLAAGAAMVPAAGQRLQQPDAQPRHLKDNCLS